MISEYDEINNEMHIFLDNFEIIHEERAGELTIKLRTFGDLLISPSADNEIKITEREHI